MYKTNQYTIHFVVGNKMFMRQTVNFVPLIGDHIRFNKKFFKVIDVVWCLDEDDQKYQRVNVDMRDLS